MSHVGLEPWLFTSLETTPPFVPASNSLNGLHSPVLNNGRLLNTYQIMFKEFLCAPACAFRRTNVHCASGVDVRSYAVGAQPRPGLDGGATGAARIVVGDVVRRQSDVVERHVRGVRAAGRRSDAPVRNTRVVVAPSSRRCTSTPAESASFHRRRLQNVAAKYLHCDFLVRGCRKVCRASS